MFTKLLEKLRSIFRPKPKKYLWMVYCDDFDKYYGPFTSYEDACTHADLINASVVRLSYE